MNGVRKTVTQINDDMRQLMTEPPSTSPPLRYNYTLMNPST